MSTDDDDAEVREILGRANHSFGRVWLIVAVASVVVLVVVLLASAFNR